MSKSDLPVVTRIESDCQSHPWSLLQFLDGFKAGHQGWIVYQELDDRELPIAFAIVANVLDENTLLNICVRPAFQQQGIGRLLLTSLLQQAGAAGIERYFLEVRASNRAAIHLYESLGFGQVATRKDYYPALIGREDGLVYSLSLPAFVASASSSAPSTFRLN